MPYQESNIPKVYILIDCKEADLFSINSTRAFSSKKAAEETFKKWVEEAAGQRIDNEDWESILAYGRYFIGNGFIALVEAPF